MSSRKWTREENKCVELASPLLAECAENRRAIFTRSYAHLLAARDSSERWHSPQMFLAVVRLLSVPELSGARHRDGEDAPRPPRATFIFFHFFCGAVIPARVLTGLDYFLLPVIRPEWTGIPLHGYGESDSTRSAGQ
jgi:hypothetical protein